MLEKDKLIGSCNLGGSMFARGKGEEHWQQALRFTKQVSVSVESIFFLILSLSLYLIGIRNLIQSLT